MKSGIKSKGGGVGGAVNRLLSRHVEKLLSIPGGKLYRKYVKASKDVEGAQDSILREILEQSSQTVFGVEHGFSAIRSYEDYVERVPVRDYEKHRPYVDRHTLGEQNVLFEGKPIMYTRSSGTTAEPKLIPISEYNFNRTIKNRGKLWLYGLSRHYPGIFAGKDFTIVSPADEGKTPDGTVTGSLSGLIYQNIPEFMKLVHTIPYEVITIADYEAKAYTLLRFGVPSNVTSIFTGNPSTILNLVTKADQWKEDLIRDIADGTIKSSINLEPEIRAMVEERLEPAPERADELDRLASKVDRFRPPDYWPNLGLVHTWTNGNCALVIPKLRPWFNDDTPMLDFGYIASEINATDLLDPATDGSILAVRSAFYEFSAFEEGESPSTFLRAHQLEVGRRYYFYVTTLSGLYRYDINDVIEVVGHFNQAPIFKFLFKGKGITNIQGEKLSEEQLIDAVNRATEETGIGHEFFVAYANAEKSVYELYIELLDDTADNRSAFANSTDRALRAVNLEYDAKRHTERLNPLEIISLGKDAFARYRDLRLKEGAFIGQLKWIHLSGAEITRNRMNKIAASALEDA